MSTNWLSMETDFVERTDGLGMTRLRSRSLTSMAHTAVRVGIQLEHEGRRLTGTVTSMDWTDRKAYVMDITYSLLPHEKELLAFNTFMERTK